MSSSKKSIIRDLQSAMNDRDIERMLALFADDYQSEQPLHPEHDFIGREAIRTTWGRRFQEYDSFNAEKLRSTASGSDVWVEWDWSGIESDDITYRARGVTIFEVKGGQIRKGRIYMEPVVSVN